MTWVAKDDIFEASSPAGDWDVMPMMPHAG
jgi:hypothetical protein